MQSKYALDNSIIWETIPETIELRKQDGRAFLEKTELLELIEWSSRRAKTYSTYPGEQASQNSVSKVREITRKAFSEYEADTNNTNQPLKTLQELDGIPQQCATLLLSMYDPDRVAYFSDELDRYTHWEDNKNDARHTDKNVPHSMKEYSHILSQIQHMRERIKNESGKDVSAVDIEIAAHDLSKWAAEADSRHDNSHDNAALVPAEQPRKRRKTKSEIWEEEHPRGSDRDPFEEIHICVDKGPNGSPTYDRYGFQLDYGKCVDWNKPTPVSSSKPTSAKLKREEEYFERQRREEKRMAKLMGDEFGFKGEIPKVEAYEERVRNDLGKKAYQVSMNEFEIWHKKGFRAKEG